ncbi:lysylphosphatidylglycerol synthase transmembrane domain-containing protein [Actibacterium sp. 188UL27-1]|uniref:lysylphosphatidylglycerol synthase transmembrane domain-containing protein n=1 Tax=Actibacterium sp. 188UL27-1 TaxID=2786961 RepID=UPI00195BEAE4|nr:lysylphosphatidylglycerol synthase transmembrane domain-containing protein [Actibacterium sp. 188UL27-1]MBM7068200.1 flippase-like domain-containing protein [Actibacterium sp. 188UL27-1]
MPYDPLFAVKRFNRDTLVLGGLLVLFLAGSVGLFLATGWEQTLRELGKLTALQVLGLLSLSMINYLSRGLRWHMFARCLGLPTSVWQDIRHFLGGFAMTVTPGRVGELVRLRWLRRETGWPFERTAPLVLVDRAADLAAMAAILGVALALSAGGMTGAVPVVIFAFAAAYIVTRPVLLARCVTLFYQVIGRWPRLFGRIRLAARSLHRFSHPGILGGAMALGLAGWLAEGWALYLLLMWMGVDIGFFTAVAIFVFSTLAGGLTGAPGGVGGAEVTMVALLGLQGIPLEVAAAATAVVRLTTLWFAIAIGLCVFPLAERISIQEK